MSFGVLFHHHHARTTHKLFTVHTDAHWSWGSKFRSSLLVWPALRIELASAPSASYWRSCVGKRSQLGFPFEWRQKQSRSVLTTQQSQRWPFQTMVLTSTHTILSYLADGGKCSLPKIELNQEVSRSSLGTNSFQPEKGQLITQDLPRLFVWLHSLVSGTVRFTEITPGIL